METLICFAYYLALLSGLMTTSWSKAWLGMIMFSCGILAGVLKQQYKIQQLEKEIKK